jgi:hypothetical protein
MTTGAVFFCHSGTGTDGAGYGRNPKAPVATLDYAVGLCTASKADRIYLMPGHAETLVAATSAVIDVAGVQVIGLGSGNLVPTFTLGTADTATVSVTAASCLIENVHFVGALVDVKACITAAATADGLTVQNCTFQDGGTAILELELCISIAAACDNVTIRDCEFYTTDAGSGTLSAISFVGASDKSKIVDCIFRGDWNTAAIDGATAAGTDIFIAGNAVNNLDAAAGLGISLHASTTGNVINNHVHGGKDATVPIVAAGCNVSQNWGTNAEGASGIILPAVDV